MHARAHVPKIAARLVPPRLLFRPDLDLVLNYGQTYQVQGWTILPKQRWGLADRLAGMDTRTDAVIKV